MTVLTMDMRQAIALAIKYHSDITEWVLMKTILGTEDMVIELNIKTIHVI